MKPGGHDDLPRRRPHGVYYIYGPGDLFLYIGCSIRPRSRLSQHKHYHRDTWWPLVQRHEIVWYPNHAEAIRVETAELRRHRPICNPVIPDANGKHTTVIKGRRPVRSLWGQMADIAAERGETAMDVLMRALENYVLDPEGALS